MESVYYWGSWKLDPSHTIIYYGGQYTEPEDTVADLK